MSGRLDASLFDAHVRTHPMERKTFGRKHLDAELQTHWYGRTDGSSQKCEAQEMSDANDEAQTFTRNQFDRF